MVVDIFESSGPLSFVKNARLTTFGFRAVGMSLYDGPYGQQCLRLVDPFVPRLELGYVRSRIRMRHKEYIRINV